ncbi:hypothetical protein, partial [Plasmodium yoelii yoelii]
LTHEGIVNSPINFISL